MRIVNRKEFLSLPNGIIYSKYQSLGIIEGIFKKRDTQLNDWYYQDFIASVNADDDKEFSDIMFDAEEKGKVFSLDLICYERDGLFDDSDLFVVYSKEDLSKLVQSLSKALDDYPI